MLADAGAEVDWFAPAPPGCSPASTAEATTFAVQDRPLHRVGQANSHIELERRLAGLLRVRPAGAVVHLGVGARGSTNVLWLAERMGARVFAAVRAAEVLCHRGDLVDERGRTCTTFDDADRCSVCCATRWRRVPRREFENRIDLLVAGLQTAAAVLVGSAEEATQLEGLGVPRRNLVVAVPHEFAAELAGRLLGR